MKDVELYGDGIGKVSYVQHVGDDKMIATMRSHDDTLKLT